MKSNQESSADIPVPESRLDQDQDLDIYDSFEMDTLSDDIPHTSRASNNSGAIGEWCPTNWITFLRILVLAG